MPKVVQELIADKLQSDLTKILAESAKQQKQNPNRTEELKKETKEKIANLLCEYNGMNGTGITFIVNKEGQIDFKAEKQTDAVKAADNLGGVDAGINEQYKKDIANANNGLITKILDLNSAIDSGIDAMSKSLKDNEIKKSSQEHKNNILKCVALCLGALAAVALVAAAVVATPVGAGLVAMVGGMVAVGAVEVPALTVALGAVGTMLGIAAAGTAAARSDVPEAAVSAKVIAEQCTAIGEKCTAAAASISTAVSKVQSESKGVSLT